MIANLWGRPGFRFSVLLVVLSFAVYGQLLGHEVLWWDDRKNLCTSWPWTRFWLEPYFGFYIPISYSAWSVLAYFSELVFGPRCTAWAPVFHLFNLVVHTGCGLLVFQLLRRQLGFNHGFAALCGALLFLFHPMQVETVAWISAGRDLLSVFFGLSALVIFSQERKIASLPFFLLSMLAKPSGIVFPFLALLLSPKQWRVLLPVQAVGFGLVVFTKSLQSDSMLQFTVALWERPLIALQSLGFYLLKFVLPWPLMPDYGRPIARLQAQPVLYLWGFFALALVALYFADRRKFAKPVAWVMIAIAPASGLIAFGFQEISTVADRYFYLPMAGMAWAVAALIVNRPHWVKGLVVMILTLCAGASFLQARIWQNDKTLFRHNIKAGDSYLSHANLANALFHEGKLQEAIAEYKTALNGDPKLRDSWLGLGRAFELSGQSKAAEDVYRQAIAMGRALPAVHNNLGKLLYDKASPECESHWLEAIRLDPYYLEPHFNLGQLYVRIKNYPRAIKLLQMALRLEPGDERIIRRLNEVHKLASGG